MNNSLDNYIFSEEDRDKIEFDQYGRPYIQETIGRFILSRKTKYNYTINN